MCSSDLYKAVIVRGRTQHSVNEQAVEKIFAEQPFILSRKDEFALRAWASYIGVQGLPAKPGVIDTSSKNVKVPSTPSIIVFGVYLTTLLDRN